MNNELIYILIYLLKLHLQNHKQTKQTITNKTDRHSDIRRHPELQPFFQCSKQPSNNPQKHRSFFKKTAGVF